MSTTTDMVRARSLTRADLEGFGRRVAREAIEAAEAAHPAAQYATELFRDHFAKAAAEMLVVVARHERSMAGRVVEEHGANSGACAGVAAAIGDDLRSIWGTGLDEVKATTQGNP